MATKKESVVRKFHGGTCEIEPVKDEPGRFWVKVRFDAKDGAGFQFEVWQDEMDKLEESIRVNFEGGSHIQGLPLAAPEKPNGSESQERNAMTDEENIRFEAKRKQTKALGKFMEAADIMHELPGNAEASAKMVEAFEELKAAHHEFLKVLTK